MKKWIIAVIVLVVVAVLAVLGIFMPDAQEPDDAGNGPASTQGVSQHPHQETEPSAETTDNNGESLGNGSSQQIGNVPDDTFTVTFTGPDGRVLLAAEVKSETSAVPPENPTMPQGYIFSHWDKDFSCVTEDLFVNAVCRQIDAQENVLALSGGYTGIGDEVTIPVQLCGNVLLCAFDIRIHYDKSMLEFVVFRNTDGAVDANCNPQTSEVLLNYVSMENTQGEVYLTELVFRSVGGPGETHVNVEVIELIAFDSDYRFYEPAHTEISGIVTVAAP